MHRLLVAFIVVLAGAPARGADAPPPPAFAWPARGDLTSCYGPRSETIHVGIDIAVPEGTPVLAAAAGRVIHSGMMPGYGNLVVVEHDGGWYSVYAHNQRNLVEATADGRALVAAGQPLAISGRTGNATGPHVHFEIRRNIDAVDPLALLPGAAR